MHGDQRILHALNRFTFGPRPGDLEAVRAMGLEQWFDQQLHPESIDQTDLDARLTQFPAMQGSPQDLLFRLPSNAIIRQVADGKIAIPENKGLQVIYENELARVELRRQEKDQKNQQPASVSTNGATTNPAMASAPIPATTQAMNSPSTEDAGSGKMAAEPSPAPQSGQMSMTAANSMASSQPPSEIQIAPSLIAEVLARPPQRRIARLAAMPQPQFDAFRKALKPPQRAALLAGLDPDQREYVAALENPQRVVIDELAYQRLTRDIYSNAQLQEVMTDFWLNHFNVYLHKNEETPYYLVSFERDVIRPLALGKFEDLLEATAHSPAMLLYLDNSSSMGPDSPTAEKQKIKDARNPGSKPKAPEGLNENYARELMELHTLGVNGGYTQADVTQVARVLTGWTVDRPQRGGGFKFDANRHEPGNKKVFGKKIKENGEQEGIELLHMLATRPATAKFLSRKLAVRFVGDDPPQSLIDRMAKSYLSSGGDISVVLKTLFHSPEFWAAGAYRAKVKTPMEFVVSAARASNATTDNLQPLVNNLHDMGMTLYGSVPPTGYNWQSSTWVSTGALVSRMNFALALAANKFQGISIAWAAPQDSSAAPTITYTGPTAEELRLESLLVAGGLSASTRDAVLDQFQAQATAESTVQPAQAAQAAMPARTVLVTAKPLNTAPAATALERQDQLLAGLLLGSPEFQRR
jgi:uncharacterized protein (DUF1800 family)